MWKYPPLVEKKRKTSQKKFQEAEADTEGLIVSKRTKSAKNGKKAKVVKDNSEEETNDEEDKNLRFQKRTILKGRIFRDIGEEG